MSMSIRIHSPKLLRCIAAALLATLALSAQVGKPLANVWGSLDAVWPVVFVAVFVICWHCGGEAALHGATSPNEADNADTAPAHLAHEAQPRTPLPNGIAVLFALFSYVGKGYYTTQNLAFLKPSFGQALVFVVVIAGYVLIYRYILARLFELFSSVQEQPVCAHPVSFMRMWGRLLLGWSPYLVLCAPGCIFWDAQWQVVMGMGYTALSNHQPVLLSFIYAYIFKFFAALGGNQLGVFALVAGQVLALSAALVWVLWDTQKYVAPAATRAALLFAVLCPMIPMYAVSVSKDTLSAALFVLQVYALARIVLFDEPAKQADAPATPASQATAIQASAALEPASANHTASFLVLLLSSVASIFVRNDGFYLLVPMFVCLCIYLLVKRSRWVVPAAGSLAVVLVVFFAWNNVALPATGAEATSSREALSLLCQNTSSYLSQYPDDLTDHEREVLDKLLINGRQACADLYNPYFADHIKGEFDFTDSGVTVADYLQVWLSMGMRHPANYLASTVGSTLGYFYPNCSLEHAEKNILPIYGEMIPSEPVQANNATEQWEAAYGNSYQGFLFPAAEDALRAIVEMLSWAPVTSLLFSPGIYVWAFIVLGLWLLVRQPRVWVVLVPVALKVAICCISSIAGSMRYVFPVIVVLPVLLLLLQVRKSTA